MECNTIIYQIQNNTGTRSKLHLHQCSQQINTATLKLNSQPSCAESQNSTKVGPHSLGHNTNLIIQVITSDSLFKDNQCTCYSSKLVAGEKTTKKHQSNKFQHANGHSNKMQNTMLWSDSWYIVTNNLHKKQNDIEVPAGFRFMVR